MDLRSIDHVALYVRDLDVAKAYYEEVFGLSCLELSGQELRTLQLEAPSVHFFVIEDPSITPDFVRRQHISFEVESLAAVVAALDARGEAYELGEYAEFASRNYRWCEWRDAVGIRVECVEHTPV